MPRGPMPDAAERERLYKLQEECAEVIAACSKILRHGWAAVDGKTDTHYDNRGELETELGNLSAATSLLANAGDINIENMWKATREHMNQMVDYMHDQPNHLFEV